LSTKLENNKVLSNTEAELTKDVKNILSLQTEKAENIRRRHRVLMFL